MINYLLFRSIALQGMSMVKDNPIMSKDETESWILKEYHRHIEKENNTCPECQDTFITHCDDDDRQEWFTRYYHCQCCNYQWEARIDKEK